MGLQRILVPLDGSDLAEQAIPFARAIAPKGTVIFAQVVPAPEPIYGLAGNRVASADEVAAMYTQTATDELGAIAKRWAAVVPNPEIVVTTGDPADRILEVAREQAADLIIIASHGRGALGRWTFGSVADRLSRTADVPVMIIRPKDVSVEPGIPHIGRIVVPDDGSELAEAALAVAGDLAKQLDREVLVVRSIFPEAEIAPTRGFEAVYTPDIYAMLTDSLEEEARKSVDKSAQTLRDQGVRAETEVRHGPAAQSIEDATRLDDIIVMTSHGRTGIRRWLIGSVAEKLVREGRCPVILVRAHNGEPDTSRA